MRNGGKIDGVSQSTILLAEDDENVREMYSDALSGAGLNVLKAEDGKEAVAIALEKHPDVILLDIRMPVMGGLEAANKIRKDRDWGKDAKIIFLTNMTDAGDIVRAIEQNPEEYIIKSQIEIKDFVNKVRMVM